MILDEIYRMSFVVVVTPHQTLDPNWHVYFRLHVKFFCGTFLAFSTRSRGSKVSWINWGRFSCYAWGSQLGILFVGGFQTWIFKHHTSTSFPPIFTWKWRMSQFEAQVTRRQLTNDTNLVPKTSLMRSNMSVAAENLRVFNLRQLGGSRFGGEKFNTNRDN